MNQSEAKASNSDSHVKEMIDKSIGILPQFTQKQIQRHEQKEQDQHMTSVE